MGYDYEQYEVQPQQWNLGGESDVATALNTVSAVVPQKQESYSFSFSNYPKVNSYNAFAQTEVEESSPEEVIQEAEPEAEERAEQPRQQRRRKKRNRGGPNAGGHHHSKKNQRGGIQFGSFESQRKAN